MSFLTLEEFEKLVAQIEKDFSKERSRKISSALRYKIWSTYADDMYIKSKCFCCRNNEINIANFECGHIISYTDGGPSNLENLRPLCGNCNKSMGKENMLFFIKRSNFWRRTDVCKYNGCKELCYPGSIACSKTHLNLIKFCCFPGCNKQCYPGSKACSRSHLQQPLEKLISVPPAPEIKIKPICPGIIKLREIASIIKIDTKGLLSTLKSRIYINKNKLKEISENELLKISGMFNIFTEKDKNKIINIISEEVIKNNKRKFGVYEHRTILETLSLSTNGYADKLTKRVNKNLKHLDSVKENNIKSLGVKLAIDFTDKNKIIEEIFKISNTN